MTWYEPYRSFTKLKRHMDELRNTCGPNTRFLTYCADIKNMCSELPHDVIKNAIDFTLNHAATHNRQARRRAITMERQKGGDIVFGSSRDPYNMSTSILTFNEIRRISTFDIEHAHFHTLGTIHRQTLGIPMGSPGSPSYAICVCMYFEHQFHQSIYDINIIHRTNPNKLFLRAQRYIDDLMAILAYDVNDIESYIRACIRRKALSLAYHENMLLKAELTNGPFAFLEGTLEQTANQQIDVRHNNKNYQHLMKTGALRLLTIKHADSFMSEQDKSNNFLNALHRIKDTSGTTTQLIKDSLEMMFIYISLGYTKSHFTKALTKIWRKTEEPVWRHLRRVLTINQNVRFSL